MDPRRRFSIAAEWDRVMVNRPHDSDLEFSVPTCLLATC